VRFIPKALIIAVRDLPRKRTHQFIQQRIGARFGFTRIRIRGALSHDIEIGPPVWRTPRLILATGVGGGNPNSLPRRAEAPTIALSSRLVEPLENIVLQT
jgi:hypothetical protein